MNVKTLLLCSVPFALKTLWVCLIAGPTAWVLMTSVKSIVPVTSSEMAAWVQAFGSIGAIIGAVWISMQHHRKEEERRAKEESDQFVKLAGLAAWTVESMRQTLEHVEMPEAGFHNYQRHLSLLDETAVVLKAVDINAIHSVHLATKWTQLGQILFDFIREGKKDDSIEKLRLLRIPHMRRSLDRAAKVLDEVYVSRSGVLHSQ